MAKPKTYIRNVWEDRFHQPDIDQLKSGLSKDATALFDQLRTHLCNINGVAEEVAWHGPCWRWSVQYSISKVKEPLVLLVPSPEDLQLAVPMDRDIANALSSHSFKRVIRDGLDMAREPFDTRWCVWSVQFANMLEELTQMIDMKHRLVTGNGK